MLGVPGEAVVWEDVDLVDDSTTWNLEVDLRSLVEMEGVAEIEKAWASDGKVVVGLMILRCENEEDP